jgi:four helix bundle protein
LQAFQKKKNLDCLLKLLNRESVSIPSNVAEGSSRKSEKDYSRFIEISLGSSFELETQLLIAQRVQFGNQELLAQTLTDVSEEQKMLQGFIGALNK